MKIIKIAETSNPDVPSREFVVNALQDIVSKSSSSPKKSSTTISAQALYELFGNAEIDGLDTRDGNATKQFGNLWHRRLSIAVAQSSGTTSEFVSKEPLDSPDIAPQDILAKDSIKVLIAIKLRTLPSISLFAGSNGYLQDKLDRIASVCDAVPSVEKLLIGNMLPNKIASIASDISSLQSDIIDKYQKNPQRVTDLMTIGFNDAKTMVGNFATDAPLSVEADQLMSVLPLLIPDAYIKQTGNKSMPSPEVVIQMAQHIMVVAFIARNFKSLTDKSQASTSMLVSQMFLNRAVGAAWITFLDKQTQQAIKKLSVIQEQHQPHSTGIGFKQDIINVFNNIAETGEKPQGISEQQIWALEVDMKSVGEKYATHMTEVTKPSDFKNVQLSINATAQLLWKILCLATTAEHDVEQQKVLLSLTQELSKSWSRWKEVISRMRPERDGPISVLQSFAKYRDQDRLYSEHYEKMFLMAHEKILELVTNALASTKDFCSQHPQSAICEGYATLEQNIQTNPLSLAMPRFVNDCFSADKTNRLTGGDISQINMIIDAHTSVGVFKEINDSILKKMVNQMIIQVQRWGHETTHPSERAFTFLPEGMMEEDSVSGDHSSLQLQESHSTPEQWVEPETILNASLLLWMLYGKAKGIRR